MKPLQRGLLLPLATFSSWCAQQMRKGGCWTSNILSELDLNPWAGTGGGLFSTSPLGFSRMEEKGVGSRLQLTLMLQTFCWVGTSDLVIMNSWAWWNHPEFLPMWPHSHHASPCNTQVCNEALSLSACGKSRDSSAVSDSDKGMLFFFHSKCLIGWWFQSYSLALSLGLRTTIFYRFDHERRVTLASVDEKTFEDCYHSMSVCMELVSLLFWFISGVQPDIMFMLAHFLFEVKG